MNYLFSYISNFILASLELLFSVRQEFYFLDLIYVKFGLQRFFTFLILLVKCVVLGNTAAAILCLAGLPPVENGT
jgi:hypothetical protein